MQSLEDRLADLEVRNAILERTDRRWRKAGVFGVIFSGAAMFMGQASSPRPGPMNATSLSIVDSTGKPRIVLGVDKANAGIVILDDKGIQRISVGEGRNGAQGDGAGISLFDPEGKPRLSIAANEGGSGIIKLDANGKPVR